MSFEPIELHMADPAAAKRRLLAVLPRIGEALHMGARLVLTVRLLPRTCPQNAKLHAMFGAVARSGWTWCGMKLDADDVKRLMVDAFHRSTRTDPDIAPLWLGIGSPRTMPSLDGSGVVTLGMPTRRFPKALASAFIDWLTAWAIGQDIDLGDGPVGAANEGHYDGRQARAA